VVIYNINGRKKKLKKILSFGGTAMKKLIPSILLCLFSYPLAVLSHFIIRITTHSFPAVELYIASMVFSLNIIALIIALFVIHKLDKKGSH